MEHGFIKAAAVTPKIKVADPAYNCEEICKGIKEAYHQGARLIVFPELCLSGYTCDDLFHQERLLSETKQQLQNIIEYTEGYEGFIHLTDMEGVVEQSTLRYIIRDHDAERFEQRKRFIWSAMDFMRAKYGGETVNVTLKDQYYNMREKIEPVMHVIEIAEQAMRNADVTPKVVPIRGGTDGAQLSFKGLPCPNIFAGGLNFHGRYEFVPIPSMEKATKVIVEIAKLVAERK